MTRWKDFGSEAQVREYVQGRVPAGAAVGDVHRFCAAEGLECSALVDGTVHASAPAGRRGLLVSAKWLMRFHFDEDGRLRELEVHEGLTGP